jgi:photosystem II stability/assembly factor-like uncharacterized protein
MGNSNVTIVKTSNSRVFLIEGRARPDHKPDYQSCLRMMGLSQGFGDIERVENPNPNQYGSFIEVGEIRGATERVTTQLEGRYALNLKSILLDLASKTCASDIQLHLGVCTDPSDFNVFEKALILEQAYLTTYNTEDLGALQSGDNAVVNETVDVSARRVYEVMKMNFGVAAGSIITNEIIDIKVCDTPSCGDCDTESDGCKKIYALSIAAGGSPGTPADVVFSPDGGTTWYAYDVDSLGAAENPSGIACLGQYVIVVSNDSNSLHYALKSEFEALTAPDFTEITTGFVSGGEPNAIFVKDDVAYIVGDNGYIYVTEDPTAGVDVLDAGSVTADNLLDVHAYSTDVIVAVGNNGAVVYTENGTTFSAAIRPVALGVNLNTVFAKNKKEWWVGTSTGRLYYTLDGGATWTEKAFAGSGAGVVYDIEFPTDSIGFMSHATATPRGRIFRSYDGGYSWTITPERAGAVLPLSDRINALAACTQDPNFVVGGGLNDNGADGIVVVGKS